MAARGFGLKQCRWIECTKSGKEIAKRVADVLNRFTRFISFHQYEFCLINPNFEHTSRSYHSNCQPACWIAPAKTTACFLLYFSPPQTTKMRQHGLHQQSVFGFANCHHANGFSWFYHIVGSQIFFELLCTCNIPTIRSIPPPF